MKEKEEKEPIVNIDNLVGTVRLSEKQDKRLNLGKLYSALNRLINSGLPDDLREKFSNTLPIEYRPEKFSALNIRIRKPPATVKIFSTWTITCVGCNKVEDMESVVKIAIDLVNLALLPEETPLKSENLSIELSNVVCSAKIGRPLGCGIVQKAFPGVEVKISKFAGGSYDISLNGGMVKVFGGGRLIGLGFKDIALAKKTVLYAIQALDQALVKYGDEDRGNVCRLERFEPTRVYIEEFAVKLQITDEVRVKAVELMRQYCQKVTKENFGGAPKTFAAAAIYIAGILCDRRLSQSQISDNVEITEVAIRSARDKIREVLKLEIIL